MITNLDELYSYEHKHKRIDISGVVFNIKNRTDNDAKQYLKIKGIEGETADEIIKDVRKLLTENPDWKATDKKSMEKLNAADAPSKFDGIFAGWGGFLGLGLTIAFGFIMHTEHIILLSFGAIVVACITAGIGAGIGASIDRKRYLSGLKKDKIQEEFDKLTEDEKKAYKKKKAIASVIGVVAVLAIAFFGILLVTPCTILGHDLVHHDAKAPTCTEDGWEAFDDCQRCDYTTYQKVAATDHDWGDWEVVEEATYSHGGVEKRVCSVCGEEDSIATDKLESETSESSSSSSSESSEPEVCHACNGTGYTKWYYGSSDAEAYADGHDPYWYDTCPICHGTGEVYE